MNDKHKSCTEMIGEYYHSSILLMKYKNGEWMVIMSSNGFCVYVTVKT